MRVLLAGGRGFLGTALANELKARGHAPLILTRRRQQRTDWIHWDGEAGGSWTRVLGEVDAVVNATGFGLEHWPWSRSQKRRFVDSRVLPGRALSTAILQAKPRPKVFIQFSGVNYYGLKGEGVVDEAAAPGDDFLAQLTVQWEASTSALQGSGIRWVAVRNAIVLDAYSGLLPLMALPVRLFAGGRLGSGRQPLPWIHLSDQVTAVRFLLENSSARGVYNLTAPTPTSNDAFMRVLARVLHRPYWLHMPAYLLRAILGQMGNLILEGRYSRPRRLLELGYRYRFATVESALGDLFGSGAG